MHFLILSIKNKPLNIVYCMNSNLRGTLNICTVQVTRRLFTYRQDIIRSQFTQKIQFICVVMNLNDQKLQTFTDAQGNTTHQEPVGVNLWKGGLDHPYFIIRSYFSITPCRSEIKHLHISRWQNKNKFPGVILCKYLHPLHCVSFWSVSKCFQCLNYDFFKYAGSASSSSELYNELYLILIK